MLARSKVGNEKIKKWREVWFKKRGDKMTCQKCDIDNKTKDCPGCARRTRSDTVLAGGGEGEMEAAEDWARRIIDVNEKDCECEVVVEKKLSEDCSECGARIKSEDLELALIGIDVVGLFMP